MNLRIVLLNQISPDWNYKVKIGYTYKITATNNSSKTIKVIWKNVLEKYEKGRKIY